ncbi:SsrA-binding protein SmpB [Candidatus Nomurabacteria bacterium]|nr:SsrA-binding protein SmpB [Candidatus Nomurabacteria bacterium]
MTRYAENRKASFNYEILEKFEAGIELLGIEVKSLRKGNIALDGAYIILRGNEAYLINCNIPPYQPNNTEESYDPTRNRKLLLTKKELDDLRKSEGTKGLTIVPISVYNKGRKIKIEIATVKGKKKFDKRQSIKKRDVEREIGRTLKN